jgi:transposase InsO family protein
MVKKCLSRMSGKLSRTVLRRGKGSNPFFLVDYTSQRFQAVLQRNGCQQSMSRKGNPYDNHPEQARMEIFKYIETYYNTKRIHTTLGWLSPEQFELQNCQNR